MRVRINKYLAERGVASRRGAEELIKEGKVKVNGQVIRDLAFKIDQDEDKVLLNNKPLKNKPKPILIILNKPVGYTCTNREFKNEKNVFELIKRAERLFSVGRLDKNSEGLLLLTNDGDLAQRLEHPSFNKEKEYIVSVQKRPSAQDIHKLEKGVVSQGEKLCAKKVKPAGGKKLRFVLTEGRKRQIRRMCQAVGLEVERLVRVRMGKWELGDLKVGEYVEKNIERGI